VDVDSLFVVRVVWRVAGRREGSVKSGARKAGIMQQQEGEDRKEKRKA
jgi:hypothetical protein